MDNDESDMYLGISALLIIISCCVLYSWRAFSEEENIKDKNYYAKHDSLPEWYKDVLENEEEEKKKVKHLINNMRRFSFFKNYLIIF